MKLEELDEKIEYGYIGGSGTWSRQFPEDFPELTNRVKLLHYLEPIETPAGLSAKGKVLEIAGKKVIHYWMHGWQGGDTPTWVCSAQLGWIFKQLGVHYSVVEGSVGGVQMPGQPGELLPPWSLVITDDVIQQWLPPGMPPLATSGESWTRMRQALCPDLRAHLYRAACQQPEFVGVYDSGVYACTPPPRVETPAEIKMIASWGAHIVGQTLGHEVTVMKRIGVHLGSANPVVNFAENRRVQHPYWVGNDSPSAMAEIYAQCPVPVARTMVSALESFFESGPKGCDCNDYTLTGMNFTNNVN